MRCGGGHGAARGEKRYCRALRTEALETRVLLAGGGLGGQDDPLTAAALVAEEDTVSEPAEPPLDLHMPGGMPSVPLPSLGIRGTTVAEGDDAPRAGTILDNDPVRTLDVDSPAATEALLQVAPGETIRRIPVSALEAVSGDEVREFGAPFSRVENSRLETWTGAGTIASGELRSEQSIVQAELGTTASAGGLGVPTGNPYRGIVLRGGGDPAVTICGGDSSVEGNSAAVTFSLSLSSISDETVYV